MTESSLAQQSVSDRLQSIQDTQTSIGLKSLTFWSYFGILISVILLAINVYQGTYVLAQLGGANGFVSGAVAFCLITGSNVLAVKRVGIIQVFILSGLVLFSISTSSIHLSTQLLSTAIKSNQNSDAYLLAKESVTQAHRAYTMVLDQIETANQSGDVRSAGWISHKYLPEAKSELSKAKLELSSSKGSGATNGILTQIADFLNLSVKEFSLIFGIISVCLMEFLRIYLTASLGKTRG